MKGAWEEEVRKGIRCTVVDWMCSDFAVDGDGQVGGVPREWMILRLDQLSQYGLLSTAVWLVLLENFA